MALTLQQWIKDFPQKRHLNVDFSPALSSLEQFSVRICMWHTCMEGWNTSARGVTGGIFTLLPMGEAGWGDGERVLAEGPNVWISTASFPRSLQTDLKGQLGIDLNSSSIASNKKKIRQSWSSQDPGHLFGWTMGVRLCSCSFTMYVLSGI